jgi:hypothetical protein
MTTKMDTIELHMYIDMLNDFLVDRYDALDETKRDDIIMIFKSYWKNEIDSEGVYNGLVGLDLHPWDIDYITECFIDSDDNTTEE